MSISLPTKGLAFSTDGTSYQDLPIVPDKIELELEQVTADSYRTVGPEALLYTDFLAIKIKLTINYELLTAAQYQFFMDYFYRNNYIYLKFANPQNLTGNPIAKQFKCGNPKAAYSLIDKATGAIKEVSGFSQSFTMR